MTQPLLLGIQSCPVSALVPPTAYYCTDPAEPRRDPQKSLNLGIITFKSHRDYDSGSEWRNIEFVGDFFFYFSCLVLLQGLL